LLLIEAFSSDEKICRSGFSRDSESPFCLPRLKQPLQFSGRHPGSKCKSKAFAWRRVTFLCLCKEK
ncbi:hypothetical protein, partial [Xanthomonas sp. LMG 12461]|uniref:hypothetical protein n=1 Tax=Xanthomonas sp. LMG 12461 TaxID=2014543 RepID=UPI001D057569